MRYEKTVGVIIVQRILQKTGPLKTRKSDPKGIASGEIQHRNTSIMCVKLFLRENT